MALSITSSRFKPAIILLILLTIQRASSNPGMTVKPFPEGTGCFCYDNLEGQYCNLSFLTPPWPKGTGDKEFINDIKAYCDNDPNSLMYSDLRLGWKPRVQPDGKRVAFRLYLWDYSCLEKYLQCINPDKGVPFKCVC